MKLLHVLFVPLFVLITYSCTSNSGNNNSSEPDGDGNSELTAVMPTTMYVGTYTRSEGHVDGQAEGIYRVNINAANGTLELVGTDAEVTNPSFLALSPDGDYLYAVSELSGQNQEATGFVFAYEIQDDNSLVQIDQIPTNALAPAHVSVDQTGSLVFAANYVGGVLMVYNQLNDGTLEMRQQFDHTGSGPHPQQQSSHLHMVKLSPDNKFVFVPDKGSDKIWSYRISLVNQGVAKTEHEYTSVQPGAGPRHMDFHPAGEFAYVINELDNTINVYSYDGIHGTLTELQSISTLPDGFSGSNNSTADIRVHPNGKFLYGSNRGHNSIVSYSINQENGHLRLLNHTSTQGEVPRNFNIAPTGDYLYAANQNSNTIVLFNINTETGALSYSGHTLDIKTPVSIVFGE